MSDLNLRCRTPILTALIATAIQFACTPKCASVDTVAILDQKESAVLVYRISGSHDKVEFFELYQAKPQFDSCGSSKVDPVAKEPILPEEGLIKRVVVDGKQLKIEYTKDPRQSIKPESARIQ